MAPVQAQAEPSQADVEVLVARLAERMAARPPGRIEDAEGWAMLGRSYAALQRFPQAGEALQRALQLKPQDPQLIVDMADVLAMQQGQSLRGEPARMVEQALRLDPKNLKALALAGSAAFEQRDYATAIRHWTTASQIAPPGSELAQGLASSLADARANLAQSTAPGAAAAAAPAGANTATAGATLSDKAGARLSGTVRLAPQLAARIAPDDTVFVFARAADGPRMPLAILRRSAKELPFEFSLDDSQAMSPQLQLSNFANVVVGARVSKSGNATPQSGDLQGQAGPLPNRSGSVELLIDSVRP
jgi:cytochrome c-type biogenesis protein CcmH